MRMNSIIFKFLLVISWLIFVGLSIEAGGLLVNFFFAVYNPSIVSKLYQTLDLSIVRHHSLFQFLALYSFILSVSVLKAVLFYVVVILMHKLDLSKPFNQVTAKQLSWISYFTLSIGLIGFLAKQYASTIQHEIVLTTPLSQHWHDFEAYLLMGAVIYIIAGIFNKGVELQIENDLTV